MVGDLRIQTNASVLADPVSPCALLIDKPQGITSFGVVKKVRWALREKKVGHAGTLDPMATGLLILLLGREATRQQDRFMGLPKVYTGTVRLGQTTASYDAETPIESKADASSISRADIELACKPLTGEIEQIPPVFSAIKKGGERLYKKARRGETVEVDARPTTVYAFDVLDVHEGPDQTRDVDIRVECSKGTYIRSLAHDLGAALGVGGHLIALRREAIGPFTVREAFELERVAAVGEARPG
ncbi:MAG: tRNA pseudouridine(55) synthase TruB [Bacteroidota bacterium]